MVSVSNEDGKLLPGMTASVKLVTASADDVLTVPSTALRFTPPEGAKTNTPVRPARPAGDSAAAPSATAGGPPAGGFQGGGFPGGPGGNNAPRRPRATGSQPGSMATLWTVDADGVLTPHRVRLGISDGQKTQITSRDLQQDASIVIGVTQPGTATAAATHDREPAAAADRSGADQADRSSESVVGSRLVGPTNRDPTNQLTNYPTHQLTVPCPSVISLDHVTRVYGEGDSAVHALRGVDLTVARRRDGRDHGHVGLRQVDDA